jgi:choline dehydrogenase-like flavoprotein
MDPQGFMDASDVAAYILILLNGRRSSYVREIAVDAFRRAGYRAIVIDRRSPWHTVGTVRFGVDPESSVLDPNCKVHDIDNLYVVDASVLPSARRCEHRSYNRDTRPPRRRCHCRCENDFCAD